MCGSGMNAPTPCITCRRNQVPRTDCEGIQKSSHIKKIHHQELSRAFQVPYRPKGQTFVWDHSLLSIFCLLFLPLKGANTLCQVKAMLRLRDPHNPRKCGLTPTFFWGIAESGGGVPVYVYRVRGVGRTANLSRV